MLTGFLGSGKTTLLNRILSESHGQRIAVIENEFGEIGVDQELVIDAEEEIFEMNNGCICCTVRGDLIRILGNLGERREKFDRIVLETTGLANPGPVAQTFFVDPGVRDRFVLDGIVTLVDARHFDLQMTHSEEARTQVAFADVIVLNKVDLVTPEELDALERRVRSINALARVVRADPFEQASVPMNVVLAIGGFDLERALDEQPTFLQPEYPFEWGGAFELAAGSYCLSLRDGPDPAMKVVCCSVLEADCPAPDRPGAYRLDPERAAERVFPLFSGTVGQPVANGEIEPQLLCRRLDLPPGEESTFRLRIDIDGLYWLFTQHLPEEFALRVLDGAGRPLTPVAQKRFAPGHSHDQSVRSVSLESDRPLDAGRFQTWLSGALQSQGTGIYRLKGFLNFHGSPDRIVIQGVHMVVDTRSLGSWGERLRRTQLVLIGRDLDAGVLSAGFRGCLL